MVKSDNIRRFPAHGFGFTLQTSRTNNRQDIDTLKVHYMVFGHSLDELELRALRSNVCKVLYMLPISPMKRLNLLPMRTSQ